MASKYCNDLHLKDYTVGLPDRVDVIYAVRQFPAYNSNGVSSKWNIPHHHLLDFFFANSPLAKHYATYFRVARHHFKDDRAGGMKIKKVKGQMLNQLIITYLYFLQAPHRHGNIGVVPILKAFGTWKHTFIRHFHGAQRDWNEPELNALEPLRNDKPKWYYKKSFARVYADRIHDQVYERAMFLLPRFKKEVLKGGGAENLIYYQFKDPMTYEIRKKLNS